MIEFVNNDLCTRLELVIEMCVELACSQGVKQHKFFYSSTPPHLQGVLNGLAVDSIT